MISQDIKKTSSVLPSKLIVTVDLNKLKEHKHYKHWMENITYCLRKIERMKPDFITVENIE